MKITEFSNEITLNMSPFVDAKDLLIDYAAQAVNDGNVTIENVSINNILITQPIDASPEHESIEIFSDYDDLPFSVLVDGFHHLLDGHHRIMTEIQNGFTEITMYVADPEGIIEEKKKRKKRKSSRRKPNYMYSGYGYGYGLGYDSMDSGGGDIGGGGE